MLRSYLGALFAIATWRIYARFGFAAGAAAYCFSVAGLGVAQFGAWVGARLAAARARGKAAA
jgi:hypothetical protein